MMNAICFRAYLTGYSGRIMPRQVRRMIGGSELHRAWLLGHMGIFEQDGVRHGPANPYRIGEP